MGQVRGLLIFLSGANTDTKTIIKTADKYKKYFPCAPLNRVRVDSRAKLTKDTWKY